MTGAVAPQDWSRADVGKRVKLGERVAPERARAPRLASIAALPDLPVRESGE